MTLPRLFTDKGELIDVDTSAMDADTLARLDKLRNAYQANKQAEQALADAQAEVSAALEAVANTEDYFNAHYPRQQFHDLWKENFAGGPRNRMTGRARM
jgi:hypothetical protein